MAGVVGRAVGDVASIFRRYAGGDGARHLVDQVRTNRHLLGVAAAESLHPFRLKAGVRAYADALARQDALFAVQRLDDVTDAMRHAGASALVVDRLVARGTRPGVAADFMRRVGRAHELDSELTGLHRAYSEAMDLHNNELGISVALEHARAGATGAAGEQALEGSVLRALADGRGLVLDGPTIPPRASAAADLRAVLRDPSRI